VRNKREVLNVEGKVKVIRKVGEKTDVRRDFGLVNSTVQTIWKDNTKMNSTRHVFKVRSGEPLKITHKR